MQCANEVIMKGTTIYEANLAAESVIGGHEAANRNIGVAKWVSALEYISWDQRRSLYSDKVSDVSCMLSGDDADSLAVNSSSGQCAGKEDSDDELDTDLAKAALDTGTQAFEAQEWEEANVFLQEAIGGLQQLPKQQRMFCDIFDLHYKLAVCAYHTQKPADAEEALTSLVEQTASTKKQREYICNAAHLLSQLYLRMGHVDRARSECEKTLQARRRLLGKENDASFESTALMAYIYFLLNNRVRARSCLALITEARRDSVFHNLETSLGLKVEHLDLLSLLTRSNSEGSDLAGKQIQSRPFVSPFGSPTDACCTSRSSPIIPQSPPAGLGLSHPSLPSNQAGLENLHSPTTISLSSVEEKSEVIATEKERADIDYTTYPEVLDASALSLGDCQKVEKTPKGKNCSRKAILDKIKCQPKDGIEDAVCEGDYPAFASLLNSKKDFWRSKLRKRVRPERVTALHFAALFGEVDMAQRLLSSGFNINEVPYGYTTSFTPLKFAIGARQVEMVGFLIRHGAKPSQPDSWATLAGQLMNRSWLIKTIAEAEKEYVPNRIIAFMTILLEQGWNVNAQFEASGGTVLHQAVTFWMGSYRWDLNVRATVTRFLYERGADPFKANIEGQTPYDMALASGHQDLLLIFGQGSSNLLSQALT